MASSQPAQRIEYKSILTGRVEDLSGDGRGIAHLNSKTVFIEGALPGEDVDFQIVRRHREYDEARIRNIRKESVERVQAMCRHYGECGGRVLEHLSPVAQLASKQKSLLDYLKRIGRVQPQGILPSLTGPAWMYRRRARLPVQHAYSHAGINVGFMEKHSKRITDMRRCEALHPKIGRISEPLSALMGTLGIKDRISKIEAAVGEEASVLVLRILAQPETSYREKLSEFAQVHDVHFYLQPGNEDSAILARDTNYLVNECKYKLLSAGVVDMFPHTAHVESMAVFACEGGRK